MNTKTLSITVTVTVIVTVIFQYEMETYYFLNTSHFATFGVRLIL